MASSKWQINHHTDWCPTASLETLQLRAQIGAAIRDFFAARGVIEVETPILSAAAAVAPHLDSLATVYTGPYAPRGLTLFLHTSPEFAMKRLLAAGSGPIYQICKSFRDGEAGRIHNPEFTLLEWYRPDVDHHALMDEVEALVSGLLTGLALGPGERLNYGEAFLRYAGIDGYRASIAELRECARRAGIAEVSGLGEDRDAWLDLLLTHVVGPQLGDGHLCFVYDYPASQAALARISYAPEGQEVAERFELFVNGIELASGYHELTNAAEQRRRFGEDRVKRRVINKPDVPLDERFLSALPSLPACAGVALGMDRLVMLAARAEMISQVLAFPIERA